MNTLQTITKTLRGATLGTMVFFAGSLFAQSPSVTEDALSSRVWIQKVAKDYLYKGNDIAAGKAERDLQKSLQAFDKALDRLNGEINDPKLKNLLTFIRMNREDIGDLLTRPYSLDNAQELIDMADAISEGEMSIARKFESNALKKGPAMQGQRYDITQVAKYYIAYKAGIKDKVTVDKMNKTVSELSRLIEAMKNYAGNTPEMNRLINKIDRDWKVVHQFYLDIEEGDLPLIVYETSDKLEKEFEKYAEAYLKQQNAGK
ncbi:type IV pili methyl-accepting chemotaxis transducer N-terminal domain-containing protein [Nitratifractor sp.]